MHADLRDGVSLCTGMIIFDNQQAPFDDPKVRQAFSLAFDREKYIDIVTHNNALPAHGVLPPGLPGYNAALQGLPYDPEKARQLLAESKYGGADKLPPIVYTSGGYRQRRRRQRLCAGADVAAKPRHHHHRGESRAGQIFRSGSRGAARADVQWRLVRRLSRSGKFHRCVIPYRRTAK